MRKMKYSGIEWIGEIPEEWNLERLKFHALFNPETMLPEFSDEDQVSFIPMDHLKSGFHTQTSTAFDKVKKGYVTFSEHDILMAKVTPCLENGNLAIATDLIDGIGFGSTEINVIRCKTINNKYLFYLLRCQGYIEKATYNMFGVAGLKRLTPEFIPNSLFPIPSPEEQQAIVEYLDTKCAEIDALITAKEKTNALLKERRQSMIYEAVTKGLDPTTPMKDSGVEWIGEIPEGWSTRRVKHLATEADTLFLDGDWINSDVITDQGVRYLTSGNVGEGSFKEQGTGRISEETFEKMNCLKALPGDLMICRLNLPLGRCCIIPPEEPYYVVAVDNVILRPDSNMDKRYLAYCMNTPGYASSAFMAASGTTMQRISRTDLGNLSVPIAPFDKQIEVADYLDAQCRAIDSVIISIDLTVQKLKEYRQSLIYEAVTGKIEID